VLSGVKRRAAEGNKSGRLLTVPSASAKVRFAPRLGGVLVGRGGWICQRGVLGRHHKTGIHGGGGKNKSGKNKIGTGNFAKGMLGRALPPHQVKGREEKVARWNYLLKWFLGKTSGEKKKWGAVEEKRGCGTANQRK